MSTHCEIQICIWYLPVIKTEYFPPIRFRRSSVTASRFLFWKFGFFFTNFWPFGEDLYFLFLELGFSIPFSRIISSKPLSIKVLLSAILSLERIYVIFDSCKMKKGPELNKNWEHSFANVCLCKQRLTIGSYINQWWTRLSTNYVKMLNRGRGTSQKMGAQITLKQKNWCAKLQFSLLRA